MHIFTRFLHQQLSTFHEKIISPISQFHCTALQFKSRTEIKKVLSKPRQISRIFTIKNSSSTLQEQFRQKGRNSSGKNSMQEQFRKNQYAGTVPEKSVCRNSSGKISMQEQFQHSVSYMHRDFSSITAWKSVMLAERGLL